MQSSSTQSLNPMVQSTVLYTYRTVRGKRFGLTAAVLCTILYVQHAFPLKRPVVGGRGRIKQAKMSDFVYRPLGDGRCALKQT